MHAHAMTFASNDADGRAHRVGEAMPATGSRRTPRWIAACTAQARWTSPLGPMTLARGARGLIGAWFDGQRHHPGPIDAPSADDDPLLRQAIAALSAYFDGRLGALDALPLEWHGTPFQQAVWQALRELAPGNVCSYGELARRIGHPAAVRAAGAAIGRNPLSLIVPCHRVVGHDGGLTGYAGGLPRKEALLRLEGAR